MKYSIDDIKNIVNGFFTQTLPKEEWTHEAHLLTAFYLISEYGLDTALCRMRVGIILYNHAIGGVSNENGGYHETLTCFWCSTISDFIDDNSTKKGFDLSLWQTFVGSPFASKDFPETRFSIEQLKSVKSRAWHLDANPSTITGS